MSLRQPCRHHAAGPIRSRALAPETTPLDERRVANPIVSSGDREKIKAVVGEGAAACA